MDGDAVGVRRSAACLQLLIGVGLLEMIEAPRAPLGIEEKVP